MSIILIVTTIIGLILVLAGLILFWTQDKKQIQNRIRRLEGDALEKEGTIVYLEKLVEKYEEEGKTIVTCEELKNASKDLEVVRNRLNEINEELRTKRDQLEKLESSVSGKDEELKLEKSNSEELKKQLVQREKVLIEAKSILQEKSDKLADTERELNRKQSELEVKKKNVIAIEEKLMKQKENADISDVNLSIAKKQLEISRSESESVKKNLEQAQNNLRECQKKLEEAEASLIGEKSQAASCSEELSREKSRSKGLESQLDGVKTQLKTKTDENRKLIETISADVHDANTEISQIEKLLESSKAIDEERKQKLTPAIQELSEKLKESIKLLEKGEVEVNELKRLNKEKQEQIDDLFRESAEFEIDLNKCEKQKAEQITKLKEISGKLQEAEAETAEVQKEIEKVQVAIELLENEREENKKILQDKEDEFNNLKSQYKLLEQQKKISDQDNENKDKFIREARKERDDAISKATQCDLDKAKEILGLTKERDDALLKLSQCDSDKFIEVSNLIEDRDNEKRAKEGSIEESRQKSITIADLQKQLGETEHRERQCMTSKGFLEKRNIDLLRERDQARSDVEKTKKEIRKELEDQIATFKTKLSEEEGKVKTLIARQNVLEKDCIFNRKTIFCFRNWYGGQILDITSANVMRARSWTNSGDTVAVYLEGEKNILVDHRTGLPIITRRSVDRYERIRAKVRDNNEDVDSNQSPWSRMMYKNYRIVQEKDQNYGIYLPGSETAPMIIKVTNITDGDPNNVIWFLQDITNIFKI